MPNFKFYKILFSLVLLFFTTTPVAALNSSVSTQDTASKPAIIKPVLPQKPKLDPVKEKMASPSIKLVDTKASRSAQFQAKLEAFKDKAKALTTDKVNANLNLINQKETSQMLKHLNIMSSILDKLENNKNLVSSNSGNISNIIAAARTNISTASAAVTAQSQKDYTLNITSETKVKAEAKRQRDTLHTDLQTVRKIVINAKQSVAQTIKSVRPIKPVTTEKEATANGKQ